MEAAKTIIEDHNNAILTTRLDCSGSGEISIPSSDNECTDSSNTSSPNTTVYIQSAKKDDENGVDCDEEESDEDKDQTVEIRAVDEKKQCSEKREETSVKSQIQKTLSFSQNQAKENEKEKAKEYPPPINIKARSSSTSSMPASNNTSPIAPKPINYNLEKKLWMRLDEEMKKSLRMQKEMDFVRMEMEKQKAEKNDMRIKVAEIRTRNEEIVTLAKACLDFCMEKDSKHTNASTDAKYERVRRRLNSLLEENGKQRSMDVTLVDHDGKEKEMSKPTLNLGMALSKKRSFRLASPRFIADRNSKGRLKGGRTSGNSSDAEDAVSFDDEVVVENPLLKRSLSKPDL